MKASDVVAQMAATLPNLTDKFTDEVSVSSLTLSGTTATATTSTVHGLSVGDNVFIAGATAPIVISSITRVGILATIVTATDHDITLGSQPTITISGATEAEFNGTFSIFSTVNRRTIAVTVDDSGPTSVTGSPLLHDGESFLRGYGGLQEVTTAPTATSFTYETTSGLGTPAVGTIVARTGLRLSASINIERTLAAYTEKEVDKLWAFVVIGDRDASKSRRTETDATSNIQKQSGHFRVQVIQPITVFVFFPAHEQIAGRAVRDDGDELLQTICQSILFYRFPSQLTVTPASPTQYVGDGAANYDSAVYVHQYVFQATAEMTFGDTVRYDPDVAFRDIALTVFFDHGTGTENMTAAIDLDEEPLP